jgi:hypothetical protein
MTPICLEGQIKNKRIAELYACMLCKELKIHRFKNKIIDIKVVKKIEGAYGLCEGDDTYAEITLAKHCPIDGRKLGFLEMMKTLAHEFVHAKQFLRGQLTCEGGFAWKGKKGEGWKYENQPWEKEAYKLEKELFMECFPHMAKFTN